MLRKRKILVKEFKNSETAEMITITMNDTPLEVVDIFKYSGATLTKDGQSEIEINIRIATATSTLVRFNHYMEESTNITTDKNTTVQCTLYSV